LAEAQRLINEEAQGKINFALAFEGVRADARIAGNPDKKKSKVRVRSILSNVNRVVNALETVGAIHPAAKVSHSFYLIFM